MTIRKAPMPSIQKTEQAAIEKFIAQAPDALATGTPEAAHESEMTQITLRIRKTDLAIIDSAAKVRRIPRASFIRQAVFQVIEQGE